MSLISLFEVTNINNVVMNPKFQQLLDRFSFIQFYYQISALKLSTKFMFLKLFLIFYTKKLVI